MGNPPEHPDPDPCNSSADSVTPDKVQECPVKESDVTGKRRTFVQTEGRKDQLITDNYNEETQPNRALLERWFSETDLEMKPKKPPEEPPSKRGKMEAKSQMPRTTSTTSTASPSPGARPKSVPIQSHPEDMDQPLSSLLEPPVNGFAIFQGTVSYQSKDFRDPWDTWSVSVKSTSP